MMDQKFFGFFTQEDKISDNVKMKTDTNTVHIDVLLFALGNDIIMENIVNSMGLEDLDHWFEFCKKFQFQDAANMDRICWKKRARKLAETYKAKPLTQPIEEIWPKKTYQEIHTLLKNFVDTRVYEIRDMLQSGVFTKQTDVAKAASLAYHGLLGLPGPHWGLRLSVKICSNLKNMELDLSEVPTAHLASLKASVSDIIVIKMGTLHFINGYCIHATAGARPHRGNSQKWIPPTLSSDSF